MTAMMMKKIEEAKAMVSALCEEEGKIFIPSTYEEMRYHWKGATPAWATLKKYASEIGLVAEERAQEWHSDGSLLAVLSGISEGTVFHYTVYRFE